MLRLCKGWPLGCEVPRGIRAELEGSDPEDDDEGVELDLDDDPEALLVFLNAWLRRVTKSLYRTLPGLPHGIELVLLDFLTSQLDRKLISHNVMVSDLEKKVPKVFSKSHDMLEVMEGLKQDKATLKASFLEKALDGISEL